MKKFILAIAAAFMAASMASAQDMAQATELYNNGATAISMKNWTEALDCFQKALEMGKTISRAFWKTARTPSLESPLRSQRT